MCHLSSSLAENLLCKKNLNSRFYAEHRHTLRLIGNSLGKSRLVLRLLFWAQILEHLPPCFLTASKVHGSAELFC